MDNPKPLVSVLIPAYNHESYVKEAVLSVVNQTYGYENIQLIVTDDCSSDKTAILLSELSNKYSFKLILHSKNIGLPSSLNEMISSSSAEYIACFASDDILVADRIERQISIMKNNPGIDILVGDGILIDEQGSILYDSQPGTENSFCTYSFEDLFLRLKPGFPAGTAIIKREVFRRIGTYDPKYRIEDYFFWLKAAYHNEKIVKCNVPFIYYRLHHKSISSNMELMNHERLKILNIYKDHPKYEKALQNHEIDAMLKLVFSNKIALMLRLIKSPMLLLNKKILKVLLMILLPKLILKWRFNSKYLRYATT